MKAIKQLIMKIRVFGLVFLMGLMLGGCLNSDLTSGEEQLKADLAAIDAHLAANNIVALSDVNGIRFTLDSLGSGYPPRYNSTITFSYTGKLLDGTVFQSSTLDDVKVAELITGLQIGLLLIPNGSKATVYVPSVFAYGSQGRTDIPPNSNLIFEIFIRSIDVTQAEKNQLGSDTVKIDNYIATAGVANVVKDSSGLRYVITQPGTGATPSWLNKVKVTYTGYIINDNGTKGNSFYTGTTEPGVNNDSRLVNFIRGFQIGLQHLQAGGKATLLVPSGLAFGSAQTNNSLVPANSSLLYEVELVEVLDP